MLLMSPVKNSVGRTLSPCQLVLRVILLKLKGQAFPVNPGSLPHTDATQDGFHRLRFLWFPEFLKTTEVFFF